MSSESPLVVRSLDKFPVCMTKEKVAQALGIPTHNIPPLVRSGLLRPLGRPGRYCVKHFSRDALAEKFASQEWLDKVLAAIHRHWRNKNARKRARQPARTGPPLYGRTTKQTLRTVADCEIGSPYHGKGEEYVGLDD